jgi:hypothetical protein
MRVRIWENEVVVAEVVDEASWWISWEKAWCTV